MIQPFKADTYPVVAVDMFAIAHKTYNQLLKKREGVGDLEQVNFAGANPRKSNAVYASMALAMIEAVDDLYRSDIQLLLLFDNPTSKSEGRRHISGDYKKNRQIKPKTFYRTVDFVQFYCAQAMPENTKVLRVPQREADDLIKILVETDGAGIYSLQDDQRVLMIANDSDWHACLGHQADMWWYTDDQIYTRVHFHNEFGFEPTLARVALYKALMGDSADNIEAVFRKKNISTETLLYIIDVYGRDIGAAERLPAVCSLDMELPEDVRTRLRDARTQFRVNLKLTDSLPVSQARLRRYTMTGKHNTTIQKALDAILNSVLHPSAEKQSFSFGGVSADV